MYHCYSAAIFIALTLSSCATGNAGELQFIPTKTFESIECPARWCINIHVDSDIYRGTHILQPELNDIENTVIRF